MSNSSEYSLEQADLPSLWMDLDSSWKNLLGDFIKTDDFKKLSRNVQNAYHNATCYPEPTYLLKAFQYFTPQKLKVVILGQDPYHQPNQAMGLAFSVPKGSKIPPSLKNIYKELEQSLPNFKTPTHGDLTHWAEQGVLLLNTTLSVAFNKANSHKNFGWNLFTDYCIQQISRLNQPKVFALWGNAAKSKKKLIADNPHNLILEATHPSPLGANKGGWFGCNHFRKINEFLMQHQTAPINWSSNNQ